MQKNNDASTVEQELQKAILASKCAVIKTQSSSTSQDNEGYSSRDDAVWKWRQSWSISQTGLWLFTVNSTTSVEAERAFSASGVIYSRLRNRLEDEALDALCFLRSFFPEATTEWRLNASLRVRLCWLKQFNSLVKLIWFKVKLFLTVTAYTGNSYRPKAYSI